MSSPVIQNFMKQQGFADEPADACNMRFQGLYFQPRIVFSLCGGRPTSPRGRSHEVTPAAVNRSYYTRYLTRYDDDIHLQKQSPFGILLRCP